LPIFPMIHREVQVYVDGNLVNDTTNYNFGNTITDFIADNSDFLPYIQYSPATYRHITMKSNQPIRIIDIRVSWINKHNGKLNPLYLSPGSSASVKLYFRFME
jgi:hypothetical protein